MRCALISMQFDRSGAILLTAVTWSAFRWFARRPAVAFWASQNRN